MTPKVREELMNWLGHHPQTMNTQMRKLLIQVEDCLQVFGFIVWLTDAM